MQRRCHHCGKRHSVAPTAWASGSSHIFAQCKQQTADTSVHIYLRVCGCMCRSVNMNRQRAAIVSPMVSLRLTQAGGGTGVKCDLSATCFALCFGMLCEDKDIY